MNGLDIFMGIPIALVIVWVLTFLVYKIFYIIPFYDIKYDIVNGELVLYSDWKIRIMKYYGKVLFTLWVILAFGYYIFK